MMWYLLTGPDCFLLMRYSRIVKTVYSKEYLSLSRNYVVPQTNYEVNILNS